MASERSSGLRTIFSFFLGLMLTAFVGVGVYTFYPPPDPPEARLDAIDQEQMEIRRSAPPGVPSEEEQARLQDLDQQRMDLMEEHQAARKPWVRTTSIILIILATGLMAASLARPDELPVISNGLLLGGVFTMLYGVGWIVATETSVPRFLVITAALIITLVLGWLRFVRRAGGRGAPAGSEAGEDRSVPEDLTGLEGRVRALEARLDRAASALHDGEA